MGSLKRTPLITFCILLIITCLFAYRPSGSSTGGKEVKLQTVFGPVDGYRMVGRQPIDDSIVAFLELDDYIMTTYSRGNLPITLYIGYYYSLDKASAAHSPLVCFPSQGWRIGAPVKRSLKVGEHTVRYAEMTASLEAQQEQVFYWYQADDDSVPEVYRNKINATLNRIMGGSPEHAFVRVSIPFGQRVSQEQARQEGLEFIASFYPAFLNFIRNSAL